MVVALAAFLLYAGTLNFDYALDDFSVIKTNRLTRQGWDAFPQILTTPYRHGYYLTGDQLYRPIPKAMFAAEWALAPDTPALGHWINVLLYAATGLVLFLTLRRYLRGSPIVAFAASLLFIAHPIHTEVVANIKSRDEILSLLFLLLALSWLHAFSTDDQGRPARSFKPVPAALFMLAFLLSLLSNESGVTFLAVFPLAVYFFTDASAKTVIRASLVALVPVLVFLAVRYSVLGHSLPSAIVVEDNLLMAAPDYASRVATAVSILGIYLKVLLFPHPLVFDRSYSDIPIVGLNAWPFVVSGLIYVSLLVFAILGFRRKDGLAFAILYYLITLSIFANLFVTIGTSYGERLMYLPSLGLCVALALPLSKLGDRDAVARTTREFVSRNATVLCLVGAIFVVYAVKTETRSRVWRDNDTLFSHDVTLAPNSARTHYYLGNLLSNPERVARQDPAAQQASLDTAIAELKKSVEIYPSYAEAHGQLGVAYFQKKNVDEAAAQFARALELNPGNPTYHSNMGLVLHARRDLPGALQAFQRAVDLDPNYSEGLANLGSTYGMMGDYDNAVKFLLRCINTAPDYAPAYYYLSLAYRQKGDQASADAYLKRYKSLSGR